MTERDVILLRVLYLVFPGKVWFRAGVHPLLWPYMKVSKARWEKVNDGHNLLPLLPNANIKLL